MNVKCNKMIWMVLFVAIGVITYNLKVDEVLWLKFNEDSGSTAYDTSSEGNDGTIYGAAWDDGEWSDDPDDLHDAREAMGDKIKELLNP